MERPDCKHFQTEKRKRVDRAGRTVVAVQCLTCGTQVGSNLPKAGSRHWELPAWDNAISDRWHEAMRRYWEWHGQQHALARQRENDAWWAEYESHLGSEKWRAIRAKVLKRAGGVCEGCGEARAAHVHHKTYERMGDEMLFDLVAVCQTCHEKIHGREIGERPQGVIRSSAL